MRRDTVPMRDNLLLAKMRALIGGSLEIVPLKGRRYLVLNQEGKLYNLPPNPLATKLAHNAQSIPSYDYIAGDAVIVPASLLE